MAKPNSIELSKTDVLPILYEDRSVLAIDKPATWMIVPFSWQKTNRNLQAAITSSIGAGHFWARSRQLRFLKYIHRLDADTTGILLFGKSQGAVESYGKLFEGRLMEKRYLAVVAGVPPKPDWTCNLSLSPDEDQIGKIKVDNKNGKPSVTHFKVLQTTGNRTLIEARPITGRTHQIRVHLAESGFPILGDPLYSTTERLDETFPLGLRAVYLAYPDPFSRKPVWIRAPVTPFLAATGFPGFHYVYPR